MTDAEREPTPARPAAPEPGSDAAHLALRELDALAGEVERSFQSGRRVLGFQEYLQLFAANPTRFGRDAGRYVRDMFDHFGTTTVRRPWGELTRYRLFDASPSLGDAAEAGFVAHEPVLIGQEDVQGEIYRCLSNFVKEGRANKLVLLHGPNGSAKSTVAACILRALERYSALDEGALYRFHWVFPNRKTVRGAIGFGGAPRATAETESYAHLDDDQIDARLVIELRDHPLLLLPVAQRRRLLLKLYEARGATEPPPDWLMTGQLSHKNQQVFEALLASYKGSLAETLRHVQVERFFISRRYRVGAITLGPAMAIDAGERQVTADRSLSALPTALQATTLFEAHGELVEACCGVLELSDLLKRPLDAFRYLQTTLETGEVALSQQTLQTNLVMIGSSNDIHLTAFREHPEFPSFRGRFEFITAPYLRSWVDEQQIYDSHVVPFLGRHAAPHATRVAAQFAVLTRMRPPEPKRYTEPLARIVGKLTAAEKMDLFATGAAPQRFDEDDRKVLRSSVERVYRESQSLGDYEGRSGVSPREVRTLLLDAAQSADYACLSPFAVLTQLDELCKRSSEYEWLREKPVAGDFHDHRAFREVVRARLLDSIEDELRTATGIVEQTQTTELFDRYVHHVGAWVKGEKLRNPHTNRSEPPDERMMKEVERLIGVIAKQEDYRRTLISMVAAWAIDHPGAPIVNAVVFEEPLRKLRDAVFAQRRGAVAQTVRDLVGLLRAGSERRAADDLREDRRRAAQTALERLKGLGYCERCAGDAADALLRARFADVAT